MTDFDPDLWPPKPKCNADLLGHQDIEAELLEAFQSGRMHHAWLISGPKGIGKATLAYRFARFILAQNEIDQGPSLFDDGLPQEMPKSLDVSAENPVFQRIASDSHGDLLAIERRIDEKSGKLKTVIDVNSVRQIGTMMSKTSSEGGWRVVVVDAADEMNINSANALLKILEEPPKNALLLLISHNPGRLLPTIRSRCRTLQLRPLAGELVTQLAKIYVPDLNDDEALRLAQLSEGSIGRALGLVDVGGLELYGQLLDILHTLPHLDVKALHVLADKVSKAGADEAFTTVTNLLRWWLERMILCAAGKPTPNTNDKEADFMRTLANKSSMENWFLVCEKINKLVTQTNSVHLDKKQVVLNAFMGLENTILASRAR